MGYVAVGALKVVDEIETRVYPGGLMHESEGRLISGESWLEIHPASQQTSKSAGQNPTGWLRQ